MAVRFSEIEGYLAVFPNKEGLKLAVGLLRNKALEQFGLALGEELLDLLGRNLLLENDFAGAEIAGRRAGLFFADVVHAAIEHLRAALRAFAERLLAGEIDGLRGLAFLGAVAEIKLHLEFRRDLEHGADYLL